MISSKVIIKVEGPLNFETSSRKSLAPSAIFLKLNCLEIGEPQNLMNSQKKKRDLQSLYLQEVITVFYKKHCP